jgi:hypothetical protein
MEVLLVQAQTREGVEFCEGLPLKPSLDEVTKFLDQAMADRTQGAVAPEGVPVPAPRARKRIVDTHVRGESTFALGLGSVMRCTDKRSLPAMNAIGFFLFQHCDGNVGDTWPATMGVLCSDEDVLVWQQV